MPLWRNQFKSYGAEGAVPVSYTHLDVYKRQDVDSVCTEIARDIRNQYTIGYYPTNTAKDGTFRSVRLELIPPKGHGKLSVRTRTGYYASKTATGN